MTTFSLSLPVIAIIVVSLFLLGFLAAGIFGGRRKPTSRIQRPVLDLEPSAAEQLRELVEKGGNTRVLMEGGFRLRDTFHSSEGFIVRGGLVLEDGSTLDGPVEVFGNATLGIRARSARPLLVHGDLTLGRDAIVPACRVEGNVFFHPGSKVDGSLECNAVYLVDGPLEAAASAEAVNLDALPTTLG